MPPKTTPITATTLRSVGDISIANINSQVVIMGQLHKVVDQLISNSVALNNKINSIGISKVKMPSIKRFNGEKVKFKEFLT
jgi:ferredoxin-fold anticodon binding domain-containing protein